MQHQQANFQKENRLANEKSPYLLQHKNNPVDWYPWGTEAFEKAKKENKLIFLSVGYSTCHWCHVMAHESFEDPETAKIMNENFVNVKVDREERPDIDKIYMTYVQAITGGGGWPMSVWMTPSLRPIVGGTYFPPRDSYGRRGFPSICLHIAKLWQDKREELESQGEKTIQLMNESVNETRESTQGALTVETLKKCYEQIARGFDPEQGGFSQAPKFPRPVVFNFLLQVYAREGPESIVGKTALNMTTLTLRKMGMGGMFDHLGGGFHRYSVTPDWHVPHFEKMLYDQGQLATVYLDVFRITRDKFYETKARDVLNYVLKSLTSPEGGIFSAEDADSLLQHGKPEHAEGAFYVWTMSELESILGPQHAQIFNYHFGVKKDGNSPPGGDPHGEFVGKNILIQRFTEQETAQRFGLPVEETIKILAHCKQKLYELRDKRPHPHLDDKIIAGWNGLMISAYARAYQVLGDPTYLEAGRKAAQFIKDKLYNPTTGKLIRNYRNGPSNISAFTDDYAFLIHSLIELYEASADITWLKWAVDLQEKQNALFWDNQNGGYFAVEGGDASLLIRMKEDYDGAEPCNNSVSALNLLRLGNMLEKKKYKEYAERTFSSFASTLEFSPVIIPFMCVALDFYLSAPQHIVIAGKPEASDTSNLLSEMQKHFQPNKVLLYADQGEGQAYLSQTQEIMKGMGMVNGKATAYVCENYTCNLPITDPQQLAILLSKNKLSF